MLDWLDKHNGAVVAIVSIAAVIVASWYAWLTRRVWHEMRRQVDTMQQTLIESHIQSEAALTAANAANSQAEATQQMFEAGNRPYLVITSGDPERRNHPNSSRMIVVGRFVLENRGSVPGVLTSWHLEARTGNNLLARPHHRTAPELVLAVFGGRTHTMPDIEIDIADRDTYYREQRSIFFEAEAHYRGLGDRAYTTRVVTEYVFSNEAMRYETREIRFG